MKRREFIAGIGTVAVLSSAAWGQNPALPRLGVLRAGSKDHVLVEPQLAALRSRLEKLGWREGKNIQIDYRWTGSDSASIEAIEPIARELIALKPDVILGHTTAAVDALKRMTNTLPIVFVSVADPISAGLVASLANPGGNITGFANFEPSFGGKLIELLKEIAPPVRRAWVMFNPRASRAYATTMEQAARSHSIERIEVPVESDPDIERVFASVGTDAASGLIVMADPFLGLRRDLLVSLAERYRVPTIYTFRFFVEAGGLMSYGNDLTEQWRQAADYIDRILKADRPANLPVQLPTKFEMVINLKSAKAIGLEISPSLLARADLVIE